MRKSRTLARIRAGETVRICNLGHYIPAYVKHAAHYGFDCIWLDLEHRRMETTHVQALLAYAHCFDIDMMVRTPTLEKPRLYAYLEDGAAGLMVPHVNTEDRARALVDAIKFPPIGDRGLDGAGFDSDFYVHEIDRYLDHVMSETFLVVQIETLQAIENIDAIAATKGVDGLFIGPGDLSLRLRQQAHAPALEECIEQVAAACAEHQKAWGMPVASREDYLKRREQGGQLIAYGGDFSAIMKGLESAIQVFE